MSRLRVKRGEYLNMLVGIVNNEPYLAFYKNFDDAVGAGAYLIKLFYDGVKVNILN